MGFIEKRPGERGYRARYLDPLGRKHSRTFARKADAQRLLLEMEADRRRGGFGRTCARRHAMVATLHVPEEAKDLNGWLRRSREWPATLVGRRSGGGGGHPPGTGALPVGVRGVRVAAAPTTHPERRDARLREQRAPGTGRSCPAAATTCRR